MNIAACNFSPVHSLIKKSNTKSLISARDKSNLGKIHTHARLGRYIVQGENCCDNVFSLQLCFLLKLETTWCVVINDPKGNPKGILVMIVILKLIKKTRSVHHFGIYINPLISKSRKNNNKNPNLENLALWKKQPTKLTNHKPLLHQSQPITRQYLPVSVSTLHKEAHELKTSLLFLLDSMAFISDTIEVLSWYLPGTLKNSGSKEISIANL